MIAAIFLSPFVFDLVGKSLGFELMRIEKQAPFTSQPRSPHSIGGKNLPLPAPFGQAVAIERRIGQIGHDLASSIFSGRVLSRCHALDIFYLFFELGNLG